MHMHKLLEKQIKKFLPKVYSSHSDIQEFIQAVDQSYHDFERDKELLEHAYLQSEEEYQELYQNLKSEYLLKKKSITKLYSSLKNLDPLLQIPQSGNLVELSEFVAQQIQKRKETEDDLKKQKEKAQEASRAKEDFLAHMSHEIRTPLNAIIGFIRELEKQKLTAAQQEFVKNCSYATHHLHSVINNVLDISKIEAGEMSLESKSFSLQESISNVTNILKNKAHQKKIRLATYFSRGLAPMYSGDVLKIEQILFNLIGNSLKFTAQGEIEVACELLKDSVEKQEVSITVKDTGIGMSRDFINNIYKKFSQEDETIARDFGGTGLGMTITEELVKLLKGKISIESEKNLGTQIKITLTLNKASATELCGGEAASLKISLEGVKVLLVEDDELNRMVVQHALSNSQCTVVKAENGKEALEILKKENFDVILMDIQMPEMDGIETTKILKADPYFATPIIALSANAFKTEIENCQATGMNDYIVKPFTEEQLLQTIVKNLMKPSAQEVRAEESPENLYSLEALKALKGEDDEFINKMISIFINQTEKVLRQIEEELQKRNYKEVSKLVHKIKPSIEGIQIKSILHEVIQLEKRAKDPDVTPQELMDLYQNIQPVLLKIIGHMKEKEVA